MQFTDSQSLFINHKIQPGEVIKVQAGPGTGKTTTAREFVKRNPLINFLYVCYNKSVQTEAETTFPLNAECRTGHSLGYQAVGKKYKLMPKLRPYNVQKLIGCTSHIDTARAIITLEHFFQSADPEIDEQHVPSDNRADAGRLIMFANDIWELMVSGKVNMTHDGYLKLWQLSKPKLPYQCILIDEGHDTNPVLADILFSQKCSVIIIGDSYQQMYSFRGAQDFMDIDADHEFKLQESFRFTPEIAEKANNFLERVFKTDFRVKGLQPYRPAETHAYLARTNAHLFDYAIMMMNKKKIGFVGGLGGYSFNRVVSMYNLSVGKKASDGMINRFKSYETLKSYAFSVEDRELLGLVRIVDRYGDAIPSLYASLKQLVVNERKAELVLTTAHKAKGLEWDHVKLGNDFASCYDEKGQVVQPKDDEANIIYVAMTRARVGLELPKELRRLLK